MRQMLLLCAAATCLFFSCTKSPEQQTGTRDSATVARVPATDQTLSTASMVFDTSAVSLLGEADIGCPVLFGFTDEAGSRILTDSLSTSSVSHQMIAFAGDMKPRLATLAGVQGKSPADNGRETSANFDKMKGLVFKVSPPPLEADRTILLVNKRFLETHKPLAVVAVTPPAVLDAGTLTSIERTKSLKAKRGWHIASLSAGRAVDLVEFYPKGDTVLLSLVLVGNNGFVFEDHPGNAKDEGSVWRVDDGGEVYPENFQILAAFDSSGVITLTRMWAGFEGGNSALLRQNGASFDVIGGDYRYWVPPDESALEMGE